MLKCGFKKRKYLSNKERKGNNEAGGKPTAYSKVDKLKRGSKDDVNSP